MKAFTEDAPIWRAYCCVLVFAIGAELARAQAPWGGAMAGSAGASVKVGNPQRGREIAKTTCAACHGLDGNAPSPQYPKLAAQNPVYLYRQLWAFRTGVRRSPVMTAIVARLTDRDMADAASYFALQPRRPDPPRGAGRAAAGERIFFTGIAGEVPACIECHQSPAGRGSPAGMGGMMGGMMEGGMMGRQGMGAMGGMGGRRMQSANTGPIPILAGQHATYLIDQLGRFADGKRPSPVMDRIAANMNAAQRAAVAAYLSTTSPKYE